MNAVINNPSTNGLTEMMAAAHVGKCFSSAQTEQAVSAWKEILGKPHPADAFTDEEILSSKVGYKPVIDGTSWNELSDTQKIEIGRYTLEEMIEGLQTSMPRTFGQSVATT